MTGVIQGDEIHPVDALADTRDRTGRRIDHVDRSGIETLAARARPRNSAGIVDRGSGRGMDAEQATCNGAGAVADGYAMVGEDAGPPARDAGGAAGIAGRIEWSRWSRSSRYRRRCHPRPFPRWYWYC